MKIGIVTMISNNYGALLQCYALQTTLQRMGNQVVVVNRKWGKLPLHYTIKDKLRELKAHLRAFVKGKDAFSRFRDNYLHMSRPVHIQQDLQRLNNQLDIVISGSDQVWNGDCMSTMDGYFFLDWVDYPRVRRFSYAASFGKDSFQASDEHLCLAQKLMQSYEGVSVRESSGIKICKDVFGRDAFNHLDPTLLLKAGDYSGLIPRSYEKAFPYICSYMLDMTDDKQRVAEYMAHNSKSVVRNIYPLKSSSEQYIRVEEWLRSIRDAEYVVTDSFHGMAFSIIFNKQFVCLNNPKRGSARFVSLLSKLDLVDRLIDVDKATHEAIDSILCHNIDYSFANRTIQEMRQEAFEYLKTIG